MPYKKFVLFTTISLFNFKLIFSQINNPDTLKVTLQSADSLFLSRNLSLLAQQYNISENEANIIQAKIWDLPTVSLNHNFYNPYNKKYFEVSSGSETSVQIQQLILIAGKRSKLVSLADKNRQIAQYQYFDLLRNLKFQLHNAFYDTYYIREKLKVYNTEIPMLHQVLAGYENMYPSGFVSLKEVVRLKALLFSLENDKLDLVQKLEDNESVLRLMFSEKEYRFIEPLPNISFLDNMRPEKYSLSDLIDTAQTNRFDLLAAQVQNQYAKTDLQYQKSLNVPNPTIIAGWAAHGSFIPNYNYLGFSFDLPLWNHNKGNIKAAAARVNESQALYENTALQVSSEVEQSFSKAIKIEKLYRSLDSKYGDDFTKIIHGTTDSFVKHEIGLLEFIDLYESYKDSQSQILQLQNDRINAIEGLNYTVGKSIN